jgi:hypothetical protein
VSLVRETVYAALFARVAALSGLKLTSRRVRSISDVPANLFPALFQAQTHQRPIYADGRVVQWELGADVYIYVKDPAGANPGALMNPLMDGLQAALAFDNPMGNACTLGGVALRCEIGPVDTDEGTMGEQAIVRAPITILVRG